jgi:hypothetical protein
MCAGVGRFACAVGNTRPSLASREGVCTPTLLLLHEVLGKREEIAREHGGHHLAELVCPRHSGGEAGRQSVYAPAFSMICSRE